MAEHGTSSNVGCRVTVRSLRTRLRRLDAGHAGRPCRVCGLAWVSSNTRQGNTAGRFAGNVVWRLHGPEGSREIDLLATERMAEPPPCACAGCGRDNVVHLCDPVGVLGFIRAEAVS